MDITSQHLSNGIELQKASVMPGANAPKTGEVQLLSGPAKQQFNSVTLLSMAFVICNSWAGVGGSLQLALLQGGPVTLVYSIILSTIAYAAVAASLAELASVYPTAGGQYHFASILAPEKFRRGVSYTCGLLALFSWVAISVSVGFLCAEQILATAGAMNEGFVSTRWQIFLVYQALVLLGLIYNIMALKRAPWTHNIGFFLTLALFLYNFMGMLIRAHPKQPSSFVWTEFLNYTGWPDGICFLTGLSTSCYMYVGLDASMHMVEECSEPERTVPQTMMSAIGIGFVTAISYTVVLLYSLTDIEEVITTTNWVPYIVSLQGFRSINMAIANSVITIVMGGFVIVAVQETTSRLAWAFARDNGLVFSQFIGKIDKHLDIPKYSLIFGWVWLFLCGLLHLVSATAIGAIIGSSIILQQLSFVIPIMLLLLSKRSARLLPHRRPFKLPGIVGWVANSFVVIYGIITLVLFNLPTFMTPTPDTMNYTCVVLAVAFIFGLLNWFLHAQKHYNGPVLEFYVIERA